MKYVVLKTDGSTETLQRTAPLPLEELQKLVSGDIEAVKVANASSVTVLVNEDGRLLNLPENPYCPGVVGDIVLGKIEDSEFVGLNDREIEGLQSAWLHRLN